MVINVFSNGPETPKIKKKYIHFHIVYVKNVDQQPLLLAWFNFNPSMGK